MQPVKLKNCLSRMMSKLDLSSAYGRYRALDLWPRVCGSQVAQITRPYALRGDTLYVGVKDPIWASELNGMQLQYINSLSKLLKSDHVRRIRFVPRPALFREAKKKKRKETAEGYDPGEIKLSAKDEKKIIEMTASINDETARELMARFLREKVKYDLWMKKNGASPCPMCGVLIPKGRTLCLFCQVKVEEKNRENLVHLLEETPWISYKDACNRVSSLAGDLYREVKRKMIDALYREIVEEMETAFGVEVSRVKSKIVTLAMMMSGKMPAQLSDKVLGENLSRGMYKFYKAPS